MAAAFNGGPDNRPGQTINEITTWVEETHPSMEGRTIVRPDRTGVRNVYPMAKRPSMEGRTIVRPDTVGFDSPPPPHTPFNGGPDNRPARPVAAVGVAHRRGHPSMEGRTIVPARLCLLSTVRALPQPFNGGPDNRPARPPIGEHETITAWRLQWRAGQSSGQTSSRSRLV